MTERSVLEDLEIGADILRLPVRDHLSMEVDRTRRLERAATIITAYQAGVSIDDLCRQYDVGKSNVYRYLREAGIVVDRKQHALAEAAVRHDAILLEYRAGLPIEIIAAHNHCSMALVSKTASAAGIARRTFKAKLSSTQPSGE